jgi:hypothetical protein
MRVARTLSAVIFIGETFTLEWVLTAYWFTFRDTIKLKVVCGRGGEEVGLVMFFL